MAGDPTTVPWWPNDAGSWFCTGCQRTIVGAHACPGITNMTPRPYSPLNPLIQTGVLPLNEEDVRRIVREEVERIRATEKKSMSTPPDGSA